MSTQHDGSPTTAQPFADYPALQRLRLTTPQLAALASQGFIREELRGNRVRYKLCFRHAHVQISRYIRIAHVAAVQQELRQLQRAGELRQRLAELDRKGRALLRDRKKALEP